MMQRIRKPAVAGQFYTGSKSSLNQEIENCFLDSRGPGKKPTITQKNKKIFGVIVPHAGVMYSGAIAAHSYNCIAENGFADTFIIIGPNHTGVGSRVSVMTEGFWETPLGKIPINSELAENLCREMIDRDEVAHQYEHSIEVQLPFLQYMAQKKRFDFVPISMAMQDYQTSNEVGLIIGKAIEKTEKKVVIIASSDFSHAGFNYDSMPPSEMKVEDYAKQQDELAIQQILKMRAQGLIETVYNYNITMCGYGPVAAMLVAVKQLGAKNTELLKYGTSCEVAPAQSCVGYGAVAVFE